MDWGLSPRPTRSATTSGEAADSAVCLEGQRSTAASGTPKVSANLAQDSGATNWSHVDSARVVAFSSGGVEAGTVPGLLTGSWVPPLSSITLASLAQLPISPVNIPARVPGERLTSLICWLFWLMRLTGKARAPAAIG